MPPVTEQEELQQLKKDLDRLEVKIDMLIIALKGNTDINPQDKGMFGKLNWVVTEVETIQHERRTERARFSGMIAGGVAVGTAAGTFIGFLITHFLK